MIKNSKIFFKELFNIFYDKKIYLNNNVKYNLEETMERVNNFYNNLFLNIDSMDYFLISSYSSTKDSENIEIINQDKIEHYILIFKILNEFYPGKYNFFDKNFFYFENEEYKKEQRFINSIEIENILKLSKKDIINYYKKVYNKEKKELDLNKLNDINNVNNNLAKLLILLNYLIYYTANFNKEITRNFIQNILKIDTYITKIHSKNKEIGLKETFNYLRVSNEKEYINYQFKKISDFLIKKSNNANLNIENININSLKKFLKEYYSKYTKLSINNIKDSEIYYYFFEKENNPSKNLLAKDIIEAIENINKNNKIDYSLEI